MLRPEASPIEAAVPGSPASWARRSPAAHGGRRAGALRRLDPAAPGSGVGAVCRLLLRADVAVEGFDADDLHRLALTLHVLALLSGSGADRTIPGRPRPGFADAGLSEARFRRLLTARGPAFRDQVVRVARFLAGRAQRLDCRQFIRLILVEGADEEAAEETRIRLARDYYAALYRKDQAARAA